MHFDFSWIKEHPYATGGIVLGGALVLYLMLRSSSSGSATAADSGADPNLTALYGSELQAQAQQNQLSAQLSATQIQANEQEDVAGLQAGVALAQNQGTNEVQFAQDYEQTALGWQASNNTTQVQEDQIDSQLGEFNDQLQAQEDQINANLTQAEYGDASNVAIANTTAGEQTAIAQLNATTQQNDTDALVQATIAQTNANAAVTETAIKNASAGKTAGFFGGLLGSLL